MFLDNKWLQYLLASKLECSTLRKPWSEALTRTSSAGMEPSEGVRLSSENNSQVCPAQTSTDPTCKITNQGVIKNEPPSPSFLPSSSSKAVKIGSHRNLKWQDVVTPAILLAVDAQHLDVFCGESTPIRLKTKGFSAGNKHPSGPIQTWTGLHSDYSLHFDLYTIFQLFQNYTSATCQSAHFSPGKDKNNNDGYRPLTLHVPTIRLDHWYWVLSLP